MFRVLRNAIGNTAGVQRISDGACMALDNPSFTTWNAAQPVPLDLSDRAPEPTPDDPDKAPLDVLLGKDPATWTNTELRGLLLLIAKRIRKGL